MRINEILLVEQLSELDEGVWDAVKSGASKVGRGIGAVGQAVGAVAGVPAGIAGAMKKGYNQSAQTIAGGPRVDTNAPMGNQQPQSGQQGVAKPGPMDFNQLTQAVRGANLTANQKTQLAQQISGGKANTPAPQQAVSQGAAPGQGASTLGAQQSPVDKRVNAQAAAAQNAQSQMSTNPAPNQAGAGAFGNMGQSLAGKAGAPMSAAPVSATNKASPNNLNAQQPDVNAPIKSAGPIPNPADVAAQAGKTTDASGRQIPALQRAAPAVAALANSAATNPNAFKYAESIQFESKFLGRML